MNELLISMNDPFLSVSRIPIASDPHRQSITFHVLLSDLEVNAYWDEIREPSPPMIPSKPYHRTHYADVEHI